MVFFVLLLFAFIFFFILFKTFCKRSQMQLFFKQRNHFIIHLAFYKPNNVNASCLRIKFCKPRAPAFIKSLQPIHIAFRNIIGHALLMHKLQTSLIPSHFRDTGTQTAWNTNSRVLSFLQKQRFPSFFLLFASISFYCHLSHISLFVFNNIRCISEEYVLQQQQQALIERVFV